MVVLDLTTWLTFAENRDEDRERTCRMLVRRVQLRVAAERWAEHVRFIRVDLEKGWGHLVQVLDESGQPNWRRARDLGLEIARELRALCGD